VAEGGSRTHHVPERRGLTFARSLPATTQPVAKAVAEKAAAELKALDAKIETAQKSLSKAIADAKRRPDYAYKPRATDDYPRLNRPAARIRRAGWLIRKITHGARSRQSSLGAPL